eukprot:4786751-Karenia_brevis.AAC.1
MFDLIEKGSHWPKQTLHSRASLLSKNPDRPFHALEYRLLLIMPAIYRLWAKTRLRHLQPWASTWITPHMHAGRAGYGAEQAWFVTSLELEYSHLAHLPYIGGALDLYKCFDQILRPLMYVVLMLAGLPTCILVPYMQYHENVSIYNSFASSVGHPHRHRCGIPQGCPLSMMFIALFLRAWICQMIELGLTPRTLADDILLTTPIDKDGNWPSLRVFAKGFNDTIQHLIDLGGKVAPAKTQGPWHTAQSFTSFAYFFVS